MNNDRIEVNNLPTLGNTFGSNFLYKHAGRIMQYPDFAIIELVANCWDAGATSINIHWPKNEQDDLVVEDNGIGMTEEEFHLCWKALGYERLKYQGREVLIPGVNRKRVVFGKNGVGRHAMFCFADEYRVETCSRENSELITATVKLSKSENSLTAFDADVIDRKKSSDFFGTKICAKATRNFQNFDSQQIAQLIGSRFIADPEFEIIVDNNKVTFENLDSISEKISVDREDIVIKRIDTQTVGRTTKQSGIAWWVNKRLVGESSWSGYENSILDGRTTEAKRYTYIIEADFLDGYVLEDWSGFSPNDEVKEVQKIAYSAINDDMSFLTKDQRTQMAKDALSVNRKNVRRLPTFSKEQIAIFTRNVVEKCPRMKQSDLNSIVEILVNLEKTRTGYSLLEKLAKCSPEHLEDLETILTQWTVDDAKKVLDELRFRLELIRDLGKLVEASTTNELYQLQPLFQKGLWIFGPEFESVEYSSNRTLLTSIKKMLDKKFKDVDLINNRRRADFIVIPDNSSLSLYARNSYDSETREVNGLASIVIIELKRGGFEITKNEKRQAEDYAKELMDSGRVSDSTEIICFVLGSRIRKNEHNVKKEGNISIYPRTYQTILSQAHARTFNLYQKLADIDKEPDISSPDSSNENEIESLLEQSGNLSSSSIFPENMRWDMDIRED